MMLTWDGDNQLREAVSPNGKEVYYYDHNGQRMLAINATDGVRFWFAENETHYDVNGLQTPRYLHLSNGGVTVARVENGVRLELQHADALQNLMVSLDETGNVAASFLSDAGRLVAETCKFCHTWHGKIRKCS